MTTNICIYPEEEDEINKILPKQLGARYWNIYEEIYLIECWAHYKNDIVSLDENGIGFRQISRRMNMRGYKVTPQDCRRKIKSLDKRYHEEVKKREFLKRHPPKPKPRNTGQYAAIMDELDEIEEARNEWPLFNVITSSMAAPYVELDAGDRIVKEMLEIIEKEENENEAEENPSIILRKMRKKHSSLRDLLRLRIQNKNMEIQCLKNRTSLMHKKSELKNMRNQIHAWKAMLNSFVLQHLKYIRSLKQITQN